MTGRSGNGRAVAAVAACLVAAAGCGSAGASKAGGSAEPVTVRLGTDDDEGAPTTQVIEAFAAQVRDLSGGSVVVEPVYAADPQGRDWDQRVAGMVTDGELEMALIPARAWDTLGVTTLRPFSAPFLVTSEDLLDAVVTSDVGDRMLAGVASTGMTGLALVPESLRYVFSFGEPLTTPASFAGTTIRSPRSDTVWATLRAWGATPDDLVGPEFDEAVFAGAVAGAETSFVRNGSLPGAATTVAGNEAIAANVLTLVVSTDVLDGLTDDQAEALRRAATATRDQIVADDGGEAAAAQEYCDGGGRIVRAPDEDLGALRAAAEPVYESLSEDPDTAALIASIRSKAAAMPPPDGVPPCGTTPPATAAAGTPDTAGVFPEGVYRAHPTVDSLVAAGMTRLEAGNHAGIWTLTFADGRVTVHDVRDRDGEVSDSQGAYCVTDGRLTIALEQTDGCGESRLFSAGWTLDGRDLQFTDAAPGDLGDPQAFVDALWGSPVWTRID